MTNVSCLEYSIAGESAERRLAKVASKARPLRPKAAKSACAGWVGTCITTAGTCTLDWSSWLASHAVWGNEHLIELPATTAAPDEPVLSIVIPAFNEDRRLPKTLAEVRRFVGRQQVAIEVLIINDGSTDGTAQVVQAETELWPALRLVDAPHRGKGGAVRAGVLAARGQFVAIADADLSMPIEQFSRFNAQVFSRCDVAIGSREAPGSHRYQEPLYRHLMGRFFNLLVQTLLFSGIKDTQCGFKVIRRSVALALCRAQTIDGWAFDVEWLVIARLHGYAIEEVPIDWYHEARSSQIHPARDSLAMTRELLKIRQHARRGRYTAIAHPENSASNPAAAPKMHR
jgi:dolichyl-phosphate beta-glucosyltransferase